MISLTQPLTYDPNHLLNVVMHRLELTSDCALARHLKLAHTVIKNIRSGRTPVSATITLLIHHATGISVDDLRALMGDRRAKFRLATRHVAINAAAR